MKRFVLCAFVACLVAADDAKPDAKPDAAKELKKFEGAWVVESMEMDGQKPPAEEIAQFRLVFDADKYSMKMADNVVAKGKIKIDPTKKPKTIDVTPSEGDNSGQLMLGIYEFDGDKMKACYAMPGNKRPEKYAAEAGSGQMLIVIKHSKDKDAGKGTGK